jgi:hypothetical protein
MLSVRRRVKFSFNLCFLFYFWFSLVCWLFLCLEHHPIRCLLLGTLAGAFIAYNYAALPISKQWYAKLLLSLVSVHFLCTRKKKKLLSHTIRFPYLIALLFEVGGVLMVRMLPRTPLWFKATDLIGAYFPMAYLAVTLSNRS